MNVVDLRCEYQTNPIGIDVTNPRLSWRLSSTERAVKQAAYRILVATSPELLERGEPDLWDSGIVYSDETAHIPYQGKLLASRRRCYWRVEVWTERGALPTGQARRTTAAPGPHRTPEAP